MKSDLANRDIISKIINEKNCCVELSICFSTTRLYRAEGGICPGVHGNKGSFISHIAQTRYELKAPLTSQYINNGVGTKITLQ